MSTLQPADERILQKALSLKRNHRSCDVELSTLMDIYEKEDRASLQRARRACRTSIKSWIDADWIDDMGAKYGNSSSGVNRVARSGGGNEICADRQHNLASQP